MVSSKTRLALSEFTEISPREWHGRYGRIPGTLSVFHLRYRDSVNGPWPCALISDDQDLATCWALKSQGVEKLIQAVRAGKRLFGHNGNGSFLINEFGQVLVPATDGDGRCAYVGTFSGNLRFTNSLAGGNFDLSDDKGLTCGDVWRLPYVGCKYNWSYQHGIHYRSEDKSGRSLEICSKQDHQLISALKQVRTESYIRFIVNPHGLVLTKCQIGSKWTPVYVGRIDHNHWFERED